MSDTKDFDTFTIYTHEHFGETAVILHAPGDPYTVAGWYDVPSAIKALSEALEYVRTLS